MGNVFSFMLFDCSLGDLCTHFLIDLSPSDSVKESDGFQDLLMY